MERSRRRDKHHYDKNVSPMEKTLSQKCIYICQEFNKKDIQTIFHSPYKNGRKNPSYINPSFISSHLFYPNAPMAEIKKGIVYNRNDIKKQQLYQQRMKKSQSFANFQYKNSENLIQTQHQRKIRNKMMNNSNGRLKSELYTMKTYNDQKANQIQHNQLDQNKILYDATCPTYLDEKAYQNQYNKSFKIKSQLNFWLKMAKEINKGKQKQAKQLKKQQTKTINMELKQHFKEMTRKQKENGHNARLLSQILREQIRAKQDSKKISRLNNY